MFDWERSAEDAKRFVRCERIYHLGQDLAWDGKDILASLLREHGGIRLAPEKREALKTVFAIIMWGELAAWKISAQLADRLEPLEAKMAATSQAHDEARHFYTMYDYLRELGYTPTRLHPAPQALLDTVLNADQLAYKLVGMQLMVETMALSLFQGVRESGVEPVLCELLTYYERDEARHVGLGVQYLPELMRQMNRLEVLQLSAFQVRLLTYALWETKFIEGDLAVLGIAPRTLIDRARRKQMAAMQQGLALVGLPVDRDDNFINRGVDAGIEYFFPLEAGTPVSERAKAAYRRFRDGAKERFGAEQFAEHEAHRIRTARGELARGTHSA
ncbi:MAG: ferritin-like domain-containing protein [Myxococcales bacterium]